MFFIFSIDKAQDFGRNVSNFSPFFSLCSPLVVFSSYIYFGLHKFYLHYITLGYLCLVFLCVFIVYLSMRFYEFVRCLHGARTVRALKDLNNLSRKLVLNSCRKIFLLQCRQWRLVPKFLNYNFKHVNLIARADKGKRLIENFKASMLNLCIDEAHVESINLAHRVRSCLSYLNEILPPTVLTNFLHNITKRNVHLMNLTHERLRLKFSALFNTAFDLYRQRFVPFLEKSRTWIENISSCALPDYVNRVLSLGPMFSIPYFKVDSKDPFRSVPLEKIITTIESKVRFELPSVVSQIRSNVCQIIKNYQNQVKKVGGYSFLHVSSINKFRDCFFVKKFKEDIRITHAFLKKNKQIMVVRADKTNKTVIIDRTDYIKKMEVLLNDTSTYKPIKNSLVPAHSGKINTVLKNWVDRKFISKNTAENLKISGPVVSRIYGLVKLHKADNPLRPIVSTINSPYYELLKIFRQDFVEYCRSFRIPC